ncbi:MAG: Nramp family divalent metal transporter [Planctomycetota bacterium]|nr:Nramp family divalent metal transporter [Planctomycetota bacterium]
MTDTVPSNEAIPHSFFGYLKSFGPGLVVVLTWLGAGDIVEMGTAGADFGYSLMWVLVLAISMRWVMVSVIARYQLCNPRGEHLVDGLCRLHRGYAPLLLVAAVLMGHLYGAYMTRGIGEAFFNATGIGSVWIWAAAWNTIALLLVFRPELQRVEVVFKILLTLLSIAFVGSAIMVQPQPGEIATGLISFEIPHQTGQYGPLLVAMGMIGAVGGSLMNLVYPYFLANKGWRGPQFRRLQFYDFLLAMAVMLVLDLSIWTLGAETLHDQGGTIETMDDLPWLLGTRLGRFGELLFYGGIFAAVFTSLIGHALGLGMLASHSWLRLRSPSANLADIDFRTTRLYRGVATWCLVSPLIWTLPGMPDFVAITLVVNALQVILLPVISGGLWILSTRAADIGPEYRNRWWEHVVLAVLLVLAISGAGGAITSTYTTVQNWGQSAPTASQIEAVSTLKEDFQAVILLNEQGHARSVELGGGPVDQHHLAKLRQLDHLTHLDLHRSNIAGADLRYLQNLEQLRSLILPIDVPPLAINRLSHHLPHCTITHTPQAPETHQ